MSFRPNLDVKETLGSILVMKLALKRKDTFEADHSTLISAKKALFYMSQKSLKICDITTQEYI